MDSIIWTTDLAIKVLDSKFWRIWSLNTWIVIWISEIFKLKITFESLKLRLATEWSPAKWPLAEWILPQLFLINSAH